MVERWGPFPSPAAFGERVKRDVQKILEPRSNYLKEWNAQLASGSVQIKVGREVVTVEVDPEFGPKLRYPDGKTAPMDSTCPSKWKSLTSADQKLLAHRAAVVNLEINKAIVEEKPWDPIWNPNVHRPISKKMVEDDNLSPEERRASRCRKEIAREKVIWQPIGMETVSVGASKSAPGVIYGLEFPWSEETLVKLGPAWLTRAFHKAGTMPLSNKVIEIIMEPTIKVTAGNNSGKFLFEVRYKEKTDGLHEKLFAKIPFPLSGATLSDRLSSSVYKQPMDLFEINTYRLLEDTLPVKIPKYYYGDISNETSNFILITERVDFSEIKGAKDGSLKPFEIEGPYEKCKDFRLRGPANEYYKLLVKQHAMIAGAHKSGKMGAEEFLIGSVGSPRATPGVPDNWGMNPSWCTGEDPRSYVNKLDAAISFFADIAKVVFPDYVQTDEFKTKFKTTMMKRNAYHVEIDFWKHRDIRYVALGHQNLNMDNAYFWRDADGNLDCGIFDFGGFSSFSLPHRIWWGLNCAEFEEIRDNLNEYVDAFIAMYKEYGGPELETREVKRGMFLTALDNLSFMVAAVPNCIKQCPVKEWATIEDRHDPRVAGDIGGKSTLRTTLRVMDNGLRMIEELHADEELNMWEREVWIGEFNQAAKTSVMINGP